jgi:site-specific DNA recombinase
MEKKPTPPSLDTLGEELHRLGLRNHNGGRVTRNGISTLLNNPFYIGIIRIRLTGESFAGIHEPLIGKVVFDRVQAVLTGKMNTCTQRHAFLFRRLLACATCHYSLIGERQKGHVYYRCHNKLCPPTSIREETVVAGVARFLQQLQFNGEEKEYFKARIVKLRENWTSRQEDEIQSLKMRQGQIKDRLNRLTDAYLDQALDKTMFEERKKHLLLDQRSVEENLANLSGGNCRFPDLLEKFLELAGNAWLSHQLALPEEKREMVSIFTSNRQVEGKKLDLKPSFPFQEIANRFKNDGCDQQRDIPRTWDAIFETFTRLNSTGQLPDLSSMYREITHEANLPKTNVNVHRAF